MYIISCQTWNPFSATSLNVVIDEEEAGHGDYLETKLRVLTKVSIAKSVLVSEEQLRRVFEDN